MQKILKLLFISASFFLLISSSCPEPDPPPPPRLEAPVVYNPDITSLKPAGVDDYFETIHISWNGPASDSINIIHYKIIRINETDTNIFRLSDSLTDYYELTEDVFSLNERYERRGIYYMVFAVDSLERPSDTSRICSVSLAPLAEIIYPSDTLKRDSSFIWEVSRIANTYESEISLMDSTSVLWDTTMPLMTPSSAYQNDIYSLPISGSLSDIFSKYSSPAQFTWSVKIIIQINNFPKSIAIEDFTVYD